MTSPSSPTTSGTLRAALDDLGLVVEGIEHVGEGLGEVVVSRVLEISAIKGADQIRRVLVDAGTGEPVEIVCGAHNFAVGDRVPLAPVGAILPGGFEIGRRKMRGVVSNGMLCSGTELGLSDDAAGLLVLGDEAPGEPGTPLMEALDLAARRGLRPGRRGQPARRLEHGRGRPRPGRAPGSRLHARPSLRCLGASGWAGGVRRHRGGRVARPLPAPHRECAAQRERSGPRPAGSPGASSSPACARSTTWSTPPTTSCSSSGSPRTPTTSRSCPAAA